MRSAMRSAVLSPVFAFVTTPSTSTGGLATMVLVSAFMVSTGMSRIPSLTVVISVFINVPSTVVILLVYRSAFQVIAVQGLGGTEPAAPARPTAAVRPPPPLVAAAAPPPATVPVLLVPVGAVGPLGMAHLWKGPVRLLQSAPPPCQGGARRGHRSAGHDGPGGSLCFESGWGGTARQGPCLKNE